MNNRTRRFPRQCRDVLVIVPSKSPFGPSIVTRVLAVPAEATPVNETALNAVTATSNRASLRFIRSPSWRLSAEETTRAADGSSGTMADGRSAPVVADVVRWRDPLAQVGRGFGFAGDEPQRQHPGPDRHLEILLGVLRAAGADLRRRLVERE